MPVVTGGPVATKSLSSQAELREMLRHVLNVRLIHRIVASGLLNDGHN